MLERCALVVRARVSCPIPSARRVKRPRPVGCSSFTSTPRCSVSLFIEPSSSSNSESAPVVIVGAGPAGLTLSALLSQYGVPSVVVEKAMALPTHPQAHFINLRTMEILRHAFGKLDETVLDGCPPREEWRDFVMCSTMLGRHFARVDNFVEGSGYSRQVSPTSVAHMSQNTFLPLLLKEAQRAAADFCPSSQILWGVEAKGVRSQSNDGESGRAHLELLVRREPRSDESPAGATALIKNDVIASDCVVAADGAGSPIRAAAGIKLAGQRDLGHLVNIHFRSKRLGQLLTAKAERAGMLYFVYNEETICVVVAHNVRKGEYAVQVPLFPPHQTAQFFTAERSVALVRHAIGGRGSGLDIDVDIRSVRPWTMNALVADEYWSAVGQGSGRGGKRAVDARGEGVFLIGDAAHQFPPAGGFGLNTGVQDAHNLAWKLAAVHHGLAPRDILFTYEQERRPVAMRNAALSVRNLKRSLRILESLGVDPKLGASAAVMDQLVRSPLTLDWSGGVSGVVSSLGESEERAEKILRLGRRQLESLRREGHPYGDARVRSLRQLLADGGGLPLMFPQHDIGFVYRKGAMASQATNPPRISPRPGGRSVENRTNGDHASVSSLWRIRLGGRMPHFNLRPAGNTVLARDAQEGRRRSTPAYSLSTVDLPDQIRGMLLSHARSTLPNEIRSDVNARPCQAYSRSAAMVSRMSLSSVLVVALPPPSISRCGVTDNDHTAAATCAAAKMARGRWEKAALSAQKDLACQRLWRQPASRADMCPVVVVLTVDRPVPVAAGDGSPLPLDPIVDEEEGIDGVRIKGVDGLAADDVLGSDSSREGHIKSVPQLNDLTACLHDDDDDDDDGHRLPTPFAEEWPGLILPMRAVDDASGRLGDAFSGAHAEAVLLRPDGHVAWVSPSSEAHDSVGDEDHLRGALRNALSTVYFSTDARSKLEV